MSRSNLEINGKCFEKGSAVAVTAAVYGIYAGFLGIEHGFFETLQGNTATEHLKIYAVNPWELPFPFGHEPAMTVIPNFLYTGIAALLCGLAIVLWSMQLWRGKRGAAVLLLLSVALLLVGGGFGPISLLIVACWAASQIGRTARVAHRAKTPMLRRALAQTWPWWLVASLLWVPAEFVAGQILHWSNDHRQSLSNFNLLLSYPMLVLFALSLVAAFARDKEKQVAPGA
jgi:hypothetical protein